MSTVMSLNDFMILLLYSDLFDVRLFDFLVAVLGSISITYTLKKIQTEVLVNKGNI